MHVHTVYGRHARSLSAEPDPYLDRAFAAAGCLVLLTGAGWLLLVGEVSGTSALLPCLYLVGLAATYATSRWVTRMLSWAAPALLVMAGAGQALLHRDFLLIRGAFAPFGYSNAAGAFFLLVAAAAVLVAVRAPQPGVRLAASLAAVLFAAIPWLNHTRTAAVLVLALGIAPMIRDRAAVRRVIAVGVAAVGTAFAAVLVMGGSYRPLARDTLFPLLLDNSLSERRLALWHDAMRIIADHPVTGVGLGRFPAHSPTAMDADTIWPHNELLHLGSEAGLPAMLLFAALLGWAFTRLWWGADDRGAAVAVIALTAVGVHANVDYILHTPAVGLAVAALVGAGSRSGPGSLTLR